APKRSVGPPLLLPIWEAVTNEPLPRVLGIFKADKSRYVGSEGEPWTVRVHRLSSNRSRGFPIRGPDLYTATGSSEDLIATTEVGIVAPLRPFEHEQLFTRSWVPDPDVRGVRTNGKSPPIRRKRHLSDLSLLSHLKFAHVT